MNDNYLIPANSKRSMLILGLFTPIDLAIFLSGLAITFLLIFINQPVDLNDVLVDVMPLLITTAMIIPVPNQHNIWTFTANAFGYLTKQRQYRWRGWCVTYGREEDKEESK